jgi:hypothetical protein
MNYWSDLIWVGNSLYPRWFVFAVMALVLLALLGGFVWLITWLTR